MAGIIDIRYNIKTRRWTAQPRFAWDAETMANGAPSVDGITPSDAAMKIAELLPIEMGSKLSCQIPRRIYRSPEYEWVDDKCVEIDGHCPTKQEWADRYIVYRRSKEMQRAKQA